jgi:hypothetical protein
MPRAAPGRSMVAVAAIAATTVAAGCGAGGAPASAQEGGAAGAAGDGPEVCDGFPMPNPAGAGLQNPASYTDNGDDTVTDDITGFTWEGTIGAAGDAQGDAAAYCSGKGASWRLPTRLELVSLVDYTIAAPGPTINAIFRDTPGSTFWTSSPYYGDAGDAWTIGFDAGYSDYGVRNNPNSVRCVRPPAPRCRPSRYQAQPGGLVVDLATGLTWQQSVDPGSYTWSDAQTYCAGVGTGWRVPSLTELQTIIDDTHEFPAIDQNVFPDTPSVIFWTSSPRADDAGSAWYVDFFYGATDNDVASRTYGVRCVR